MLHVLTGTAKGRRLKVPRGRAVRPTTGRTKKSIFDTLGNISGMYVLDIFAGSGSLGIEALSRGAARVTFIEKERQVLGILRENLASCGFEKKASVLRGDYRRVLSNLGRTTGGFDLIFLDPPYKLYRTTGVEELIQLAAGLLGESGLMIIEHNYELTTELPGFVRACKSFGETRVSYFTKE